MPRVIIKRSTYSYGVLRADIFGLLEALGGKSIARGSEVLIKPNLLAPAAPEKAVTTHPYIVRAAAEYALERGARVQISDSPAVGSFEKILTESGLKKALEGLPVRCVKFVESVDVPAPEPFRKIEIAGDAVRADFVINLPKFKTHSQMLLTLGVKNLFGCVVGFRKPEWHFRAGVDREMFAKLLVSVYRAIMPRITILDGILAMEGRGPGRGGRPKALGLLIGADDAAALDYAVCGLLGIEPGRLLTNKLATRLGLLASPPDISVIPDGPAPAIRGFELPGESGLVFGPRLLRGFLRKHLSQRPHAEKSRCVLCGLCWKYCPAGAIASGKRKPVFDYERCIRCYCCVEVCPEGALVPAEKTLAGRMIRRMLGS